MRQKRPANHLGQLAMLSSTISFGLGACGEAERATSPAGDDTASATGGAQSTHGGESATDGQVAPLPEADAPRARAEARCRRILECCSNSEQVSETECVERFRLEFEGEHQRALELGLIYDEACMRAFIAAEEAQGCETSGEPPVQTDLSACRSELGAVAGNGFFHGALAEGEQCTLTEDYFSDCALGMTCSTVVGPGVGVGICQDSAPAPEPYTVLEGGDCSGPGATCEEGHFCSSDTSLCTPAPLAGEPCPSGICEAGAFCDRSNRAALV